MKPRCSRCGVATRGPVLVASGPKREVAEARTPVLLTRAQNSERLTPDHGNAMTARNYFTELPDDTPDSIAARARADFDGGLLSAAGVLDALASVVSMTSGFDVRDKLKDTEEALGDERSLHAVCQWQLKVALAALKDLREKCGELSNEVNACLGRLTSPHNPPSVEEVSEYDGRCATVLKELDEAAEVSCLRPGRDDDFRTVAARLDLLDEEPD